MTEPPTVLVMARAPRLGEVRKALEPMLGAERCLLLQAALIRQATEWALALAPQSVHVAHSIPARAGIKRRGRRERGAMHRSGG